MNLEKLCNGIEKTALEACTYISDEAAGFDPFSFETKGVNDFVTHVDRGSETLIVNRLSALLPEAGFITEEATSSGHGERYNWVIDPLDGTTNFIHGLHPHAVSIGLTDNGEPVAGVVAEVGSRDLFKAWEGGGAWLNGKKINVSPRGTPSQCLVATGFPYKDFSRLKGYLKCLEWFMHNTRGIRRMGSASIDLAYVACGRFDLFFEYGINPWDVTAGIVLVREAGGVVTDFSGNDNRLSGEEIIAANNFVHPLMLEIISNFIVT